ncbi:MAG: GTPase Era [Gemmatimonadetes bacterium]|nr:MAG: GTPase Era [Gemmatimonadota bacterium]
MTDTPASSETRSGYVTLLGRPNAGKSTLLNRFVGEKLSIVTPRAQTTWRRVTGIRTTERVQMIFLDTPGLLEARDLLQHSMLEEALEAVREADVLLLLVDSTRPPSPEDEGPVLEALDASSAPLIAAVNKIDEARPEGQTAAEAWVRERLKQEPHAVSALRGDGIDGLLQAVEEALPPGPFLYPPDEIASDPVRFFVAELIRETVFERFRKEIPYAAFCQVEEFREGQKPVYIQANLYVERKSQKRILVGEKGTAVRELGRAARQKIEHFIGEPVYLDLWVKVLPKWRREGKHLSRFGLRVPHERTSR